MIFLRDKKNFETWILNIRADKIEANVDLKNKDNDYLKLEKSYKDFQNLIIDTVQKLTLPEYDNKNPIPFDFKFEYEKKVATSGNLFGNFFKFFN